jgi:hypothetical protein
MYQMNPFAAEDRFRSFEIVGFEIDGNSAVCHYTVDGVERRLQLRRIDRKWLVHMPEQDVFTNREFSLNLWQSRSGGFASAESAPMRIGDLPQSDPEE